MIPLHAKQSQTPFYFSLCKFYVAARGFERENRFYPAKNMPQHRLCRDPKYAYVIPVTTQSYGEPRAVPTCLSRQGQAQNTLGKHQTLWASPPGGTIN